MKAASLLRYIWVGCFICCLFLAATGVAYAGACNNGTNGKAATVAKAEVEVQQVAPPVKKKTEAAVVSKDVMVDKQESKQTEVKKEAATAGNYFSFSFLYYLFYKTNFAETTNSALRSSFKTIVCNLLD
ncbi:hypothetical protein [Cesiribacter sp. SM1]|uniref:hypothetical protein n=1 Tax=Cesiribacter sp. SM1 TaxID=2861196 RepID=UPI001CD761FD|nr:hypothetical protein [Cesiribacter sp. SM1]